MRCRRRDRLRRRSCWQTLGAVPPAVLKATSATRYPLSFADFPLGDAFAKFAKRQRRENSGLPRYTVSMLWGFRGVLLARASSVEVLTVLELVRVRVQVQFKVVVVQRAVARPSPQTSSLCRLR